MTAGNDLDLIAVMHHRANVPAVHGDFRQGGQRIQTGKGARGRLNARGFRSHLPANESKDFRFKLQDAIFRVQHLAFPFFQSGRGVSFGIRQRLTALVIRWHPRSVRLRNLNEIAENVVVANPQRTDAGARAFLSFHGGDGLFSVATESADFIEFRGIAAANNSAIDDFRRRIILNCRSNQAANVGELVRGFMQNL